MEEPPIVHDWAFGNGQQPTNPTAHHQAHDLGVPSRLRMGTTIKKHNNRWRGIVKNTGPVWFSVPMATGIMAAQIILIPYQARWLWYLCLIMFFLNIVFLAGVVVLSVLRYSLYPALWTAMLRDARSFIFLGACPIALATIVEVLCTAVVPYVGDWCVTLAWVLWMINAVLASGTTVFVCYLLSSSSTESNLSDVNASQLLPISASVVSAGVAARVAQVLPDPNRALGVLITGYIQWGMAVPLIFTVIALYYHRLVVHRLPPKPLIISCFVPMGPLGFGGFGDGPRSRRPRHIPADELLPGLSAQAGEILFVVGFLVAIVMWGFGLVWCALACVSIARNLPIPFTMAYWGLIFPIGYVDLAAEVCMAGEWRVYSASCLQMGAELESEALRMLGTIITVFALLLYVFVFGRTCVDLWNGTGLVSPDLQLLRDGKLGEGMMIAQDNDKEA